MIRKTHEETLTTALRSIDVDVFGLALGHSRHGMSWPALLTCHDLPHPATISWPLHDLIGPAGRSLLLREDCLQHLKPDAQNRKSLNPILLNPAAALFCSYTNIGKCCSTLARPFYPHLTFSGSLLLLRSQIWVCYRVEWGEARPEKVVCTKILLNWVKQSETVNRSEVAEWSWSSWSDGALMTKVFGMDSTTLKNDLSTVLWTKCARSAQVKTDKTGTNSPSLRFAIDKRSVQKNVNEHALIFSPKFLRRLICLYWDYWRSFKMMKHRSLVA